MDMSPAYMTPLPKAYVPEAWGFCHSLGGVALRSRRSRLSEAIYAFNWFFVSVQPPASTKHRRCLTRRLSRDTYRPRYTLQKLRILPYVMVTDLIGNFQAVCITWFNSRGSGRMRCRPPSCPAKQLPNLCSRTFNQKWKMESNCQYREVHVAGRAATSFHRMRIAQHMQRKGPPGQSDGFTSHPFSTAPAAIWSPISATFIDPPPSTTKTFPVPLSPVSRFRTRGLFSKHLMVST